MFLPHNHPYRKHLEDLAEQRLAAGARLFQEKTMATDKMALLNILDPKDARTFLSGLKVNGVSVTGVETPGGWVLFSDATDAQIVSFANQIMRAMEKRAEMAKGKGDGAK